MVWIGVDPFCFIIYMLFCLPIEVVSDSLRSAHIHKSTSHVPRKFMWHGGQMYSTHEHWEQRTCNDTHVFQFQSTRQDWPTAKYPENLHFIHTLGTSGPTTDGSLCWSHGPSGCFFSSGWLRFLVEAHNAGWAWWKLKTSHDHGQPKVVQSCVVYVGSLCLTWF